MELRTFIKKALLDIVGGVTDAQTELENGEIVPAIVDSFKSVETGISDIQSVEFEVAVTTENHKGSEAKLNVVAAVVGGGVKGQSGSGSEHVARLHFRVPVRLPRDKA